MLSSTAQADDMVLWTEAIVPHTYHGRVPLVVRDTARRDGEFRSWRQATRPGDPDADRFRLLVEQLAMESSFLPVTQQIIDSLF